MVKVRKSQRSVIVVLVFVVVASPLMDIYWRGEPLLDRKFKKFGPPSMLPEDTRPKVRK
jgi:hypothetical protein